MRSVLIFGNTIDNTLFISELKELKMNISYLYDLIICKIKYLYIIFFKKIATDERKFEKI